MKFELTGDVLVNFNYIKENMRDYGYFYSGHRILDDDVRLIFNKYGTKEQPQGPANSTIAFSYARLVETTENGSFRLWLGRALRDLFKEEKP